jgi:hypothetical protein
MIYAVLNRLKNDTELTSLLGVTGSDFRIYPLFTKKKGTCIVYTDAPVSGGDIKDNRLELRIIDSDYDKVLRIENALNRLLDIPEGEPGFIYENVNIMSSILNGGGSLENESTGDIERILYYEIKWRWY